MGLRVPLLQWARMVMTTVRDIIMMVETGLMEMRLKDSTRQGMIPSSSTTQLTGTALTSTTLTETTSGATALSGTILDVTIPRVTIPRVTALMEAVTVKTASIQRTARILKMVKMVNLPRMESHPRTV